MASSFFHIYGDRKHQNVTVLWSTSQGVEDKTYRTELRPGWSLQLNLPQPDLDSRPSTPIKYVQKMYYCMVDCWDGGWAVFLADFDDFRPNHSSLASQATLWAQNFVPTVEMSCADQVVMMPEGSLCSYIDRKTIDAWPCSKRIKKAPWSRGYLRRHGKWYDKKKTPLESPHAKCFSLFACKKRRHA